MPAEPPSSPEMSIHPVGRELHSVEGRQRLFQASPIATAPPPLPQDIWSQQPG
jgi:hypothetical protein